MIVDELKKVVAEVLKEIGIENPKVELEHPAELSHGDFSTNVALAYAKELKMKPRELAEKIVEKLEARSSKLEEIEKIEIAGPGFINFHLTKEFFAEEVAGIGEKYGKNKQLSGKKVMVEYTDPNPFKAMHIGHYMSNTIGESIVRIVSFQGAEVKRASYQGDIGLHVAKAIWAYLHSEKRDLGALAGGDCYVRGTEAYEQDEATKAEIQSINKKLYERSDRELQNIYEEGKKLSLVAFDVAYKKLGTDFDFFFFESEVAERGVKLVREHIGDVFEMSDGAVVFKGEKHDPSFHTRVFLNSQGLPTYEAKELGLAKQKEETYPSDISLYVTGNEIREYFKVLQKAMELILPELQGKIHHIPHGMLRLPGGKMSSRTGKVITGEALVQQVEELVQEKVKEREMSAEEKNMLAEIVAVGAIKYSILRQAIGGDIIFDFEKSISFEGDSGPYLQYSFVRAKSVLGKAVTEKISADATLPEKWETSTLEKMLVRFPEVVERAGTEYQPHYVTTYLTELSGVFNRWYAGGKIIDASDPASPYKLALTEAFATVMKNGLWLLGIKAPEKM